MDLIASASSSTWVHAYSGLAQLPSSVKTKPAWRVRVRVRARARARDRARVRVRVRVRVRRSCRAA
jgi:hypothetical protein